jgi:hypothetical protein
MTAIARPFSIIIPGYPKEATPVLVVENGKALVPVPGTAKLIWVKLEGLYLGGLFYSSDEVGAPPWKHVAEVCEADHEH